MTSGDGERSGGAREPLGAPGPRWSGSGLPPPAAATRQRAPGAGAVAAEQAPPRLRVGDAELEIASFRRRAAGWAVDSLLLGVAVTGFSALLGLSATSPSSAESQILVLLFRVGYNWPWNSIGWSPGKRAVGLRLVRGEGGPPGPLHGFGRSVGALVSDLLLGFGYLWALWDRNNQTWHDKLAGTYVVRLPPAEDGRGGSAAPPTDARP